MGGATDALRRVKRTGYKAKLRSGPLWGPAALPPGKLPPGALPRVLASWTGACSSGACFGSPTLVKVSAAPSRKYGMNCHQMLMGSVNCGSVYSREGSAALALFQASTSPMFLMVL